jgi:NAD(P)H-dependent flavin oxidoreductase YrpB (nitropropane dioxygenase family)
MIQTRLTLMPGLRYPVIQAGMGPFDTRELAVAASSAGALGVVSRTLVPVGVSPAARLRENIEKVASRAPRFGVNIPVSSEYLQHKAAGTLVDVAVEARRDPEVARRLRVIITSAGNPVPHVRRIKDSGALHFHVVSSVEHALKAERAGVDLVIASGWEGGGHLAHDPVTTSVLLPAVVRAVKVPVVAAGGFADGAGLVAALAHGAEGIQIGTRFIATRECPFHETHKELILKAAERDTLVVPGASGGCRVLRTPGAETWLGEGQAGPEAEARRIDRFLSLVELGEVGGDAARGLFPAGIVAGRIDDLPSVAELLVRLESEAETALARVLRHLAPRQDDPRRRP